MLYDIDAGERVAAWAELDSAALPATAARRSSPAVLAEGHRHLVAPATSSMSTGLPSNRRRLRRGDQQPRGSARRLARRSDRGGRSRRCRSRHRGRSRVASAESFGRLRHMWAETAAELGDGAPPFTVDSVEDSGAARAVQGSFEDAELPRATAPRKRVRQRRRSRWHPRPQRHDAQRVHVHPAGRGTGEAPVPVVLYGHGLLGSRSEVLGIGGVGATVGIGFCALDWIGMSTADIPDRVLASLDDLTVLRSQPDRLQQGHLAWLLLGRLLASESGFVSDPAFQDPAGATVIAPHRLSFLGASQGGILGGVPSALSADWSQVILAVPGMGYNLLLPRSIDFDQFAPIFEESYPDPLDRGPGS
ncbi:MAG: hypothetical protein R2695_14880 [Acidimicrobiales bacterium]